ncbi:hypothetical protein MPH_08886 [Macrophomina phaseolina MS6]|uniref:Uncharacterized protein n=1 Tax=Macrophomina phaseolina (strain MS6) TaxID=1126212 RepID=K2RMC7_MACPH|nr:hypothetical protein MPH_08886 [Macrophomina phaseolina MS6]
MRQHHKNRETKHKSSPLATHQCSIEIVQICRRRELDDLEHEAEQIVRLEQLGQVKHAAGQVSQLDAGKGVDGPRVPADAGELRVLEDPGHRIEVQLDESIVERDLVPVDPEDVSKNDTDTNTRSPSVRVLEAGRMKGVLALTPHLPAKGLQHGARMAAHQFCGICSHPSRYVKLPFSPVTPKKLLITSCASAFVSTVPPEARNVAGMEIIGFRGAYSGGLLDAR